MRVYIYTYTHYTTRLRIIEYNIMYIILLYNKTYILRRLARSSATGCSVDGGRYRREKWCSNEKMRLKKRATEEAAFDKCAVD